MVYSISPSACGGHIVLVVDGDIDRRTAMRLNLEAHALGKDLGLRRYLVDLRGSRNTDSLSGQFEFAYEDMQNTPGIDRLAKVALLVAADDHSHDFIETVTGNAGLTVRIFRDLGRAESYLANG